jgi:hypothetical protein
MTTMTKSLVRAVALATAVFGLAACEDSVYVNRSELINFSGETYVQFSAAVGTNQIVVFNSPYAPDPTINAMLAAAKQRYASDQYRFFAGPPVPDWNGYTLIVAFSEGVQGNQNLCRDRQAPLRPMRAGWTDIFAEYCLGNILISETKAYTRPVTGPDDPKFSKLMGSVFASLFEYRLPTSAGSARVSN